jgi:hypothetical protein
VQADAERPQFADASFVFAISDAGRLSGAIPIDGSQKWRGSSDLAVHGARVAASASGCRTHERPPSTWLEYARAAGGTGMVLPAYEWAQFAVAEEHYFVLAGEPPVEINSDGHGAEVGVIVIRSPSPAPRSFTNLACMNGSGAQPIGSFPYGHPAPKFLVHLQQLLRQRWVPTPRRG